MGGQTCLGGPNANLVAPYRAILRYYRCDAPYRTILFKGGPYPSFPCFFGIQTSKGKEGGQHSPKMVRYPPPWCLILHRHICAIPHFLGGHFGYSLTLQSLLFSISLLFSFSDFPCFFLCAFPLFSKDFRGSAKRTTLAFLGKNPCFFQKSKDWRVRVFYFFRLGGGARGNMG